MREHDIDRHSRWTDVKKRIDSDSRYRAVDSSLLREDYFLDYCKILRAEKDEKKKSKDKERDRKDKKDKKSDKDRGKDEKRRDSKDSSSKADKHDKDNEDQVCAKFISSTDTLTPIFMKLFPIGGWRTSSNIGR